MSVKCLAQYLACQCSIAHTLLSLLNAPWAITLIGEQSALIGEQSTTSHGHFSCVCSKCSGISHVPLTDAPLRFKVLQASCWLAGFGYHFWFDYSFLSTPFVHMLRLNFQILGHLRYKPSLANQPLGDRIPIATTWADSKWLRMKEKNVDLTWTETWTWLSKLITVMLPQM